MILKRKDDYKSILLKFKLAEKTDSSVHILVNSNL